MTALGIILLIVGLVMLFMYPQLSDKDIFEGEVRVKRKAPSYLLMFNKRFSAVLMVSGVLFMMVPYLFFFADRGYSYLLVFPTGKMNAVTEQGIKWRGFAKIDDWQKFIDVKVVDGSVEADEKELEGIMAPVPLRFIDQVTATGYVSLRFKLPEEKESFIQLAIKYRTMSNLVNNTIIPTVREQLVNTGYMFAAQNYISGEAQSFRQTFEEQLKSGTYAVKKIEHKDTIYDDIQSRSRRIKEIQTKYEVVKIMENGVPKRISHELSLNNIIVSQVIVDKLNLEKAFKQRLEAQRDESAKRQLEQQKIETAKAAQQRIVAEGERDKAGERVNQEKEQVKQLIAIETKLKQETTNRELAEIALKTERLKAEAQKVKADAESYQNKKLVQAGLTPQERAQLEKDIAIGVAKEMAKINFPQTMIITGDEKGGSGTPLEALIGAAMAKQLTEPKITKKR